MSQFWGLFIIISLITWAWDVMKRCHDKAELVYWAFDYGLFKKKRLNDKRWSDVNGGLSGSNNTGLVCSEQFFLECSDVGEISAVSLDLKQCHFLCTVKYLFSSWNVENEAMFFYCMSCQLILNLLLSLNCEVICYLPKFCILVI